MKNIFVEGIQGMGKSTLVNCISQKYPALKVCREGDYSPVDLAWCTWMGEEEYKCILDRYEEVKEEIMKYTTKEQDKYIIAYTKIITDIPGFHKDLENYEVYNGRKSWEELSEIILKRFENFQETGYLLECAFFQNIMEDLILFHQLSDQEIVEFYRELFSVVHKDKFLLYYLHSDAMKESVIKIKKERCDDKGQEIWFEMMLNYLRTSPYGVQKGIQTLDDMVAHFKHRQDLEMRIIDEVLGDCAVVLPSKKWQMEQIR